eukprot:1223756-Pleurochrysis_carterae.AAC.1
MEKSRTSFWASSPHKMMQDRNMINTACTRKHAQDSARGGWKHTYARCACLRMQELTRKKRGAGEG